MELGVASAYLEDEIDLLKRYNLLTVRPGGKYQAHLVIFTKDYLNEFYRTSEQSFAGDVYAILSGVREKLPEIRSMGFPGSDFDDNRLIWSLLFNTVGLIGACAVRSGALTIPDDDTLLGAFIYETENA